jgi:pyruvate formate lyase activating enzyme
MSANKVMCLLCPKHCTLRDYERGDCRVRVNVGGELHTLIWAQSCAANIDPIEKKPLFHFLPASWAFSIATAGCNLHCKFCQNWQISQSNPEDARNIRMEPEEVVKEARMNKCPSISYTYSEPIIFYEYVKDTARLAREKGLRNVLVTAGFIEEKPLRELCALVDATNTDLKSIRDDYYRDICDGELAPVQRAIQVFQEEGVWQELTYLIVPTLNDSEDDFYDYCRWIYSELGAEVPLHISRFFPMYQLKNLPPTPASTLNRAREIALEVGLNFVYVGNLPGNPGENTYCPQCKNVLIERRGYNIGEVQITPEGKCPYCGRTIPGVWR